MGCVYSLFCVPTQKEYIGKTIRTFPQRMIQHRHRSKKSDLPLYNAVRKYGWDSFILSVVFTSSDEALLLKKEQEYIRQRNTYFPVGYNMTLGGEGTSGTVHSEQWKQGNKRRAQNSGKPVYCLETNIVYPTVIDAARATDAVSMTVSGICSRPDHKSKKLHYCFSVDKEDLIALAKSGELYQLPVTWNIGAKNGSARAVYCLELDRTFPTMNEAMFCIGRHASSTTGIVNCCTKKAKSAYGYHWRYADEQTM